MRRRRATTSRSIPRPSARRSRPRARASRAASSTCSTTSARATCRRPTRASFEVGRNVATTEGAVVFENELFQLIEYKPLTAKVHERPMLMVPPCINKFYILDLQPENSLVRYAVEQGHTVFLVSWRNPTAEQAALTWDDYIEDGGPIKRDRGVRNITAAKTDRHARLLHRRHDPGDRARRARGARRAAGGEHDAADDLPRFQRHRHPRHLHRRERSVQMREMTLGAASPAAAACSRARNSRRRSASCARTTWSGTTSSATT